MTKSISVLMRNLYDSNPEVRGRAAMDLGENMAIDAVSSLIKVLLTDEEVSVRSICAEALGTIAEPSSLSDLINALNSEKDERVLSTINWAINSISKKLGKSREEILAEFSSMRSSVIDRISKPSSESNTIIESKENSLELGKCCVKACDLQAVTNYEVILDSNLPIVIQLCQKHINLIKK